MTTWHTQTVAEVFEALHSGERGLDSAEAKRRLEEYGPNKLPEAKVDGLAIIFFRQFRSPLIYILIAAAIAVFALGEPVDGAIILAVLLLNAVIGTLQEGRARNTLSALKKFVETSATVLREDREEVIPDYEVVPGDVLILQEGDRIPADARIISANNLKADEAALTGESGPVHKVADALTGENLAPAEQRNMAFKGTHVISGNGRAVVVAIGINTTIGQISAEIASIDSEIPLKANIRYLSRAIIVAVAAINAVLFIAGVMFGKPVKEMFATVVSLSVSIIPEGLPIVMTLVLASGVWRMSKRNALVKRLQAVEALGQTRVILVDKTGTITKNEMVIRKVHLAGAKEGADGKLFEIGGVGYEPKGEVRLGEHAVDPLNHPELLFAGKIAAFCANARTVFLEEEKQWKIFGDPTEAALLVFSQKLGFHKDALEQESPRIAELPFDYKTKYHATVHQVDGRKLLVVIGAPEAVLDCSANIARDALEADFVRLSAEGLRVLGMAVSYDVPENLSPEHIKNLTFIGFVGMKDALRPEVREALGRSREAGIRVVMITGDHKRTAQAIAAEAGIWREGDEVLTGADIDAMQDQELSVKLDAVSVFARVTPEHKLRIVRAYKSRKEIVAMTGDGVNDALSLVAADLGVAMGKIGTEVAKEASDIILLDDNFGSIVSAVEEGRSIYKTIKKVILYLFSTGIGEVLTIAGALFLGYPIPLLPSQIIWLNFVTDGFLDVSLAMEPKEEGLLAGNFEHPKKYLVDKLMVQRMFFMAIPMMIGTLFLFWEYLYANGPLHQILNGSAGSGEYGMAKAWTISLTTLAVFQWFNAWNCRHESKSVFRMNPFANKFLVLATGAIIVLQLLVVYHPVMQRLFKTAPLTLGEWLIIVAVAFSIVVVEEVRKFWYRRRLS
ncbi:MAG: HAD-IC family P-type ATPase [Candidatus Sungbacteria bacterium]|nr:HAD-IC family P-type ATPase [Candidatus Sungbacteria bacterium]